MLEWAAARKNAAMTLNIQAIVSSRCLFSKYAYRVNLVGLRFFFLPFFHSLLLFFFDHSSSCVPPKQDNQVSTVVVDSATTAYEAGNLAAQQRIGQSCVGWTVIASMQVASYWLFVLLSLSLLFVTFLRHSFLLLIFYRWSLNLLFLLECLHG
jgi:hypothetical protein